MDEFRIDSHKLMYHVERIEKWNKSEDIYPIYMEISVYGGCNHRCIFCALDYLEYKPTYLNTEILKGFLKDIALKGVKSVMFSGEGEPLLHKDITELIICAKQRGLDVAITTNGVLLSPKLLKDILPCLSWLRISLNAGTPKTYSLIHRTQSKDFYRVIENIREAVKLKKKKKISCTVGIQLLLLRENYKEVCLLAKILRNIGADYLIIKPYSQHPKSYNCLKFNYEKFFFLEDRLKDYEKNGFKIIFRKETMLRIKEKKPYKRCLGLPFWAYLASRGDLYACSAFLGDKNFSYGNIYEESFEEVWQGKKRKKIMRLMQDRWDVENCRHVCRLEAINRYLWELKNPPAHVNFI